MTDAEIVLNYGIMTGLMVGIPCCIVDYLFDNVILTLFMGCVFLFCGIDCFLNALKRHDAGDFDEF